MDEATTDSGQEPVPNEILFLSQEGQEAAVEDVWPELHGCFEAAKQVDPEALDLVLLGFEVEEVDGVGRITGAVQALGPDAPGFLDCLVSWMSGFAFEAPEGGAQSLGYDFVFSSPDGPPP